MAANRATTTPAAALRARRDAERAQGTIELPAEIEERIEAYVPASLDSSDWAKVRPVVTAAVRRAQPVSADRAQHWLLPAAKLALWADRHGVDLTVEAVFSAEMVDEWAKAELAAGTSKASVATHRSHLRNLLPITPTTSATIGRRDVSAPYTRDEDLAVARAAAGQRTVVYRADACLLYGLARGAGLGSQQIKAARTDDVAVHDDGSIEVRCGNHNSWVLDEYCDIVRTGLELRDRDGYLFAKRDGSQRNIGEYIDRFTFPDATPRLNVARCRSTWIVDHLQRGTPIDVIAAALGVTSLDRIRALLAYVEARPADVVAQLLRGLS